MVSPVCREWLSRKFKGDGLENESMLNRDVYKFYMTQYVSSTSLTA